jgi:hypothetical protein
MLDQQNADIELTDSRLEDIAEFGRFLPVESGGRLVKQKQSVVSRQAPRQFNEPPLAG